MKRRMFPKRPRVEFKYFEKQKYELQNHLNKIDGKIHIYKSIQDVEKGDESNFGESKKNTEVTTAVLQWGCWLDNCACEDTVDVPFPDIDFSAHPPRSVRAMLMKHLSYGHNVLLYK